MGAGHGSLLICAGVKNMLAGEQQAAVTVAVEGLMEARPVPELEAFATYDPKVDASLVCIASTSSFGMPTVWCAALDVTKCDM